LEAGADAADLHRLMVLRLAPPAPPANNAVKLKVA
jgi:hypothetical protein